MIRKILFWSHLVAGITGGVLIAVMSFTGAALTFEKDLIAWAERDARRVAAPAPGAARLPLEDLIERVHQAQPDARFNAIIVSADPREAVAFATPNNRTFCANPYTGEIHEAQAPRMRSFLGSMRSWHTRLNIAPVPGSRSTGNRLNAAANFLFVFLGLSGLVLWWPRAWNARVLRPSLWLNPEARGRARDWNWHNAIGFWSLPLILVLAGTGVVLSYQWAGNLVFRLAGETPPVQGAPPVTAAKPAAPPRAAAVAGLPPLTPNARLTAAQKVAPDFQLLTLRFNPALFAPAGNPPALPTFTVVVKAKNQWPLFSQDTLVLDAVTGEVQRTDTFADLSLGLRARRWIRVLHSGEALGRVVQALSGLACLGGCVLVYTGFALAWRRFFSRTEIRPPHAS